MEIDYDSVFQYIENGKFPEGSSDNKKQAILNKSKKLQLTMFPRMASDSGSRIQSIIQARVPFGQAGRTLWKGQNQEDHLQVCWNKHAKTCVNRMPADSWTWLINNTQTF